MSTKLYAVRLKGGVELRAAIEQYVQENSIKAATVISGIGALDYARLRMAGAQPGKEDIREYKGKYEIISLSGNLGEGRTHLHIALSDSEGNMHGGHLKNAVTDICVELVLAVDERLVFTEEQDAETGYGELMVTTNV
jgi:predicted DNA-binding protein with PD1-like motif